MPQLVYQNVEAEGCANDTARKAYEPVSLGSESKSLKSVEQLQRPPLSSRRHNYDLN